MKKPVYSTNGEGETVVIGFEHTTTPNQKELETREAGIRLAREIGREIGQRRSLKSKLLPYMVETDDKP